MAIYCFILFLMIRASRSGVGVALAEEGSCSKDSSCDDLKQRTSESPIMIDIKQHHVELEKNGWTIIPAVLTQKECEKHKRAYRRWLDNFGDEFPPTANSIIHTFNVAHHPNSWKVRLQVKRYFAALWGTEKLLSSFDGIAIGPPPEEYGEDWFQYKDLYAWHHDQGAQKMGLHAYQGAVYLNDADEDDFTFALLEGSHKYHREFFKDFLKPEKRPYEYRRLHPRELDWFKKKDCPFKRLKVPKGSLLLWDSRLVHSGARPMRGRKHPDRWRYLVFVCMTPAKWAREKDLKEKVKGYKGLMASRHWPGLDATNFEPTPVQNKKLLAVRVMPKIAQSDEVKRLVGLLPYPDDGQPDGPDWIPEMDE